MANHHQQKFTPPPVPKTLKSPLLIGIGMGVISLIASTYAFISVRQILEFQFFYGYRSFMVTLMLTSHLTYIAPLIATAATIGIFLKKKGGWVLGFAISAYLSITELFYLVKMLFAMFGMKGGMLGFEATILLTFLGTLAVTSVVWIALLLNKSRRFFQIGLTEIVYSILIVSFLIIDFVIVQFVLQPMLY